MTLEELEGYFTGIPLPEKIILETGVVVDDVPLFLESHFAYIHANAGSKSINVYMLRLHRAIEAIENPVPVKAPMYEEGDATEVPVFTALIMTDESAVEVSVAGEPAADSMIEELTIESVAGEPAADSMIEEFTIESADEESVADSMIEEFTIESTDEESVVKNTDDTQV